MAEATNPIATASNPRVGPAPCVPDCSAADHLDYLSEVIVQCVKNDGVMADALGAIEAVRVKAASAPNPPDRVGEEVDRDHVVSARLIPWEPGSLGGVDLTFESGLRVALPLSEPSAPSDAPSTTEADHG